MPIGIPLILYNRTSDELPVTSVICDPVPGEQLLVDKLLAAGHRRFGIITGPEGSFVGDSGRNAAATRLREANIVQVPVRAGDFTYESGATALRELLMERPDLEAVIAVNDLMAIGAIDLARGA